MHSTWVRALKLSFQYAVITAALVALQPGRAVAVTLDADVTAFIDEYVSEHSFSRSKLQHWFAQARVQHGILRAMENPTTSSPWHVFRASHVSAARINGGVAYWRRNADMLAKISAESGVPEELLVATVGIESFYGRLTGTSKVFDALVTLAFYYPKRAERFRGELGEFLLLTRELQVDPLQIKGSYAGALGVPQFLPSSYRRYAVDGDGDGKRDLWNHGDALASIANYYKGYGWQTGEPVLVQIEQSTEPVTDEFKTLVERGILPHTTVGAVKRTGASPAFVVADDVKTAVFAAETEAGTRYWMGFNNFYVITRYNRSVNYALAVYELAQELRGLRRSETFD
ncbi:MAG: mltB [Betaproteobacteria bacterium]|nr:mltB [Betaproteobacteria bacterium]